MRGMLTALAVCTLAGVVGCKSAATPSEQRIEFDRMLVTAYTDSAITNAIVAQHTIFPYHFESNADKLNELGQRDVAVLAAHYRQYPGPISVRRGDASKELYDARVREVTNALINDGVAQGNIKINDALPGGEGMTSERVVLVSLQEKKIESQTTYMVTGTTKEAGAP